MKKLLLSGCIVFGSISFASAQATDPVSPAAASKTQSTTAVKSSNPQKAARQAQEQNITARGTKIGATAAATSTNPKLRDKRKPQAAAAKVPTDANPAKQN